MIEHSTSTSTSTSMTSSPYTTRLSFDSATTNNHHRQPPPQNENLTLLKPHRSSESAFEAITTTTTTNNRPLTFRDFKLIRRVGSGDISTVYLCRLRSDESSSSSSSPCEYAMKVVDKEALVVKNKTQRAEMEKKILKMLDHPFLPSLYAQFDASHFSCIVMEFCSGGDLHSIRSRFPNKRFPLQSARFYAAEVLVALEYLHMLGIIYRDLKPENVLLRSDGHIMLSDFDLSLCSDSIPAVHWPHDPTPLIAPSSSPPPSSTKRKNPPLFACLPYNRLFRSKKIQTLTNNRLFVAEPVSARSCSFVGTHEYIAPEVASGNSHGNAVDWWALGIFIYEMIYGRTPFVGPSNAVTLKNILKKPLTFPTNAPSSTLEGHARDLISGLLHKDPVSRVGFTRGAADIKTHPFFKGLNFALVRSVTPPAVPGLKRPGPHQHPSGATSFKDVTVTRKKETTPFDYF